jgi:hypothetical protein
MLLLKRPGIACCLLLVTSHHAIGISTADKSSAAARDCDETATISPAESDFASIEYDMALNPRLSAGPLGIGALAASDITDGSKMPRLMKARAVDKQSHSDDKSQQVCRLSCHSLLFLLFASQIGVSVLNGSV